MAITTSFSVTAFPLAMCFSSASGSEKLEKMRWLVMLTLIGVLGANQPGFSFTASWATTLVMSLLMSLLMYVAQ